MMSAAAQRTPVSLLLDMCNQNGWMPEYELTSVIGASHDPTFTFRVTVGDVTATASGQSKRKAKHSAAKSALEQLVSKIDPEKQSFVFESETVTAENLNNIMIEPILEPVPVGKDSKNAVGVLQEHCVKNKLMPPYYETTNESGPAHDKTFAVRCMVEHFTTYGEGKTKKIAKRVAAEIMLQKLVDDGISFAQESEQKGGNKENISSSSSESPDSKLNSEDLLNEINTHESPDSKLNSEDLLNEIQNEISIKLISDQETQVITDQETQVISDKESESSNNDRNDCITHLINDLQIGSTT